MCSPRPFNAVFRELLTVVKQGTDDPAVKRDIKKRHRAFNPHSPEHAEAFHAAFHAAYPDFLEKGAAAARAVAADLPLLVGRPAAELFGSLAGEPLVRAHACFVALLSLSMAAHVSDDAPSNAAALQATERALGEPDAGALAEVILDEDLVAFVKAAGALLRIGGACGLPLSPLAGLSDGGSIMSLARGLTADLDPRVLESPDGMQKLIASVSEGIGEQMSSGKLDVAALMKEASALIGQVDLAALAGALAPKK